MNGTEDNSQSEWPTSHPKAALIDAIKTFSCLLFSRYKLIFSVQEKKGDFNLAFHSPVASLEKVA